MPDYVLNDASLLQDNLKSFGKVSFEPKPLEKTLILAEPLDIDETTITDPTTEDTVCDATDSLVEEEGGAAAVPGYSSPSSSQFHVYILVKDFATDLPIPGATVKVGNSTYTADSSGRAYVGRRKESTEFSLHLSKTGYLSSADDELANDSFSTPAHPDTGTSSVGTIEAPPWMT